jgi:hypothetical protein
VRFRVDQRFDADVDAVARAYADPDLYAALDGLPKLTQPQVLSHAANGDTVHLEVRYRFGGELSAAAKAVIDPARLTWVERSTHDLARRTTTFRMLPDHYADRFRCEGTYRFEPDGDDACTRRGEGELRVRALLVAAAVEGAIVSGLREHLMDEIPVVEAFLADRG